MAAAAAQPVDVAALKADLAAAQSDVAELIKASRCNPILLRTGFHDAGTYDRSTKKGGAIGATHFAATYNHANNAGLPTAVELLGPIKDAHPLVSWADLFQMASAVAVELAGGPKIPLQYGRVDASRPDASDPGNLPAAAPEHGSKTFHDGSATPAQHLRRVFGERMGLSDRDIVALSGAHTLGRAKPSRSGFGKEQTKYTEVKGMGTPGGQSWTAEWLTFSNDYFVEVMRAKEGRGDPDLLVLPTDAAVFDDPAFAEVGAEFARDKQAFFRDYATAHVRMSELGVTWAPGTPVTL
jgi:L-ascorbate peroxidase